VKIAVVVQRYGAAINGGAEQHARYLAEHLARHVQVEVLTTCASDYITWRNEWPEGVEAVHGITVRRFPVTREREPAEFAQWSERVFDKTHSLRDELAWLDAEGPTSPALVDYIRTREADYDFFLFFSFRYYHAYHGARAVPGKAILVPTAERDGALGLGLFGPVFRGVRAIMYNSAEERALIHGVAGNQDVPGVVVGVGSLIPEAPNGARFRQKYQIRDRFAVYVGRIDENKGCRELFDFFEVYSSSLVDGLHLVLIGNPVIPIPDHPRVHHVGFVSDEDKFDAIAAAELLIMPSYFESLSMVAIEAWALGKPVLANAACDVLQGQCLRSNGGLFYESVQEFFETLRAIDGNPALARSLGQNGRRYFEAHYTWPVIERKYTDMLSRLSRETASGAAEAEPGWWARRRRTLAAANEVVRALPRGPAELKNERSGDRAIVDDRRSTIGDSSRRSAIGDSDRRSAIGDSDRRSAPGGPDGRPRGAEGRQSKGGDSTDRRRTGRDSHDRRGGNQQRDRSSSQNQRSTTRQSPVESAFAKSSHRQQSPDRQSPIVNAGRRRRSRGRGRPNGGR
jgi:glycosyltransferase involved in cell wall biosynthesis